MNSHGKCRTWIALAAAVLLLFAIGRYSRPQIDPRLVGEWTIHYEPEDATWPAEVTYPIPSVRLRADGTAIWWCSNVPNNAMYAPYRLRWSAGGNRLVWRHEYTSAAEAMRLEYDRLRYRFGGRGAVAPHESLFEIVGVADDEILVDTIARDRTRHRWVLRRAE